MVKRPCFCHKYTFNPKQHTDKKNQIDPHKTFLKQALSIMITHYAMFFKKKRGVSSQGSKGSSGRIHAPSMNSSYAYGQGFSRDVQAYKLPSYSMTHSSLRTDNMDNHAFQREIMYNLLLLGFKIPESVFRNRSTS